MDSVDANGVRTLSNAAKHRIRKKRKEEAIHKKMLDQWKKEKRYDREYVEPSEYGYDSKGHWGKLPPKTTFTDIMNHRDIRHIIFGLLVIDPANWIVRNAYSRREEALRHNKFSGADKKFRIRENTLSLLCLKTCALFSELTNFFSPRETCFSTNFALV